MSHESAAGLQSPAAMRYPPYSFHLKPTPSYSQPFIHQKLERPLQEAHRLVQEPGPVTYQAPQPASQMDWVIENLHQETARHNETRLFLHSSRKVAVQLEQLLNQERAFNHSLRVQAQDAEMKKMFAEEKARAYERQGTESQSAATPLSDYKSATFSPSINLTFPTISETSLGKRKACFPAHNARKRLRSASPTGSPESDVESEEE